MTMQTELKKVRLSASNAVRSRFRLLAPKDAGEGGGE